MDRIYDILKSINQVLVSSKNEKILSEDKLDPKNNKACYMMNNEEEEKDDNEEDDPMEMEIELEVLKQKLMEIKKSNGEDFTEVEDLQEEDIMTEMMEYKNDFFQMSLGSVKSIAKHAQAIVDAVESGNIKDGLTESWLQGKIAVTEDYMLTIHNFLMFGKTETDTEGTEAAKNRPGLWENIRKKREKMGKNYRPATPGEKDRPDSDQWKKLTK